MTARQAILRGLLYGLAIMVGVFLCGMIYAFHIASQRMEEELEFPARIHWDAAPATMCHCRELFQPR